MLAGLVDLAHGWWRRASSVLWHRDYNRSGTAREQQEQEGEEHEKEEQEEVQEVEQDEEQEEQEGQEEQERLTSCRSSSVSGRAFFARNSGSSGGPGQVPNLYYTVTYHKYDFQISQIRFASH